MKKHFVEVSITLIIILIICVMPILVIYNMENNKTKIKEWADVNEYEIIKIESVIFDLGPFWYKDDNDEIYRVHLRNKYEDESVAWFRIGLWTFDQEWENNE